jgi:hypothetical protein
MKHLITLCCVGLLSIPPAQGQDTDLRRIYMSGGRWYGTPKASPGWVYVYQQKDADHYELVSKIKTRPGSGTTRFVPELKRLYVASQAIGEQQAAILAFEPVP